MTHAFGKSQLLDNDFQHAVRQQPTRTQDRDQIQFEVLL